MLIVSIYYWENWESQENTPVSGDFSKQLVFKANGPLDTVQKWPSLEWPPVKGIGQNGLRIELMGEPQSPRFWQDTLAGGQGVTPWSQFRGGGAGLLKPTYKVGKTIKFLTPDQSLFVSFAWMFFP